MNMQAEAGASSRVSAEDGGIPRSIADHGVLGDLATLALVAKDGAIDFMCWPNFDSPTIFAALSRSRWPTSDANLSQGLDRPLPLAAPH
ncbi:trehalase-like domain-containing protein [Rhizobium leguminosarum]|uniref:trehalase-like domain-containing protein n=1 Tax=Rhizobium leguminosarum TaxID=384 RepID=UPI0021B09056|nr:trehalase-like domain-containing protein [Rhizobium leguminosarum]